MPIRWPRRERTSPRNRERFGILAGVLAVLITTYGGLLRFDALQGSYGNLKQPQWSATLARYGVPLARELRPDDVHWTPVAMPYIGGDPQNYLRFAREMTHFYQAHVREPVYLSLTKAYLWSTGNSDIAVSFASATGSTLAILATYLLGAAAVARVVGLAAAAALAIEFEAIAWSVRGWRDDTFMLFVALTAWAFIRLRQRPSFHTGVLAGIAAAGACLTRISALSFVLPALLWMVVDAHRAERRALARQVAAALAVCALLVAPYLINCALATGDPFVAINHHTRFYQHADGLPRDHSVTALEYLGAKIADRPIAALDTGVTGLVGWPFYTKWRGFRVWWEGLGGILRWSAAAGLVLALWFRCGRLLLVILLSSLAPYALTWSLTGGGEWRFTMHVYPFYLVAAFGTVYAAARAIGQLIRGRMDWRRPLPARRLKEIVVVCAILALSALAYSGLPFLVAREALLAGLPVNITAGDRDRWFFEGDWSRPIDNGIHVRVAQSPIVGMRVPLPEERDYAVTVRMDPAETADVDLQPRVTVFVNRHTLMHVRMTRDPHRMGAYRVRLPRELAGSSATRLEFVATHTVDASDAGRHFAALPGDTPVAFRLWYVRIEPIAVPEARREPGVFSIEAVR